jgi:hypothetical protein
MQLWFAIESKWVGVNPDLYYFKKGGAAMTTKGKKSLSNFEKNKILLDTMEILTCGDKEIVDAFAGLIEAQVKVLRLTKKRVVKS